MHAGMGTYMGAPKHPGTQTPRDFKTGRHGKGWRMRSGNGQRHSSLLDIKVRDREEPNKNVKAASLNHRNTRSRDSEGQEKWSRSDRLTAKL